MDTVVVLMSTYNGEKYLKTQIESILNQKKVLVKLLVRDDGSTDKTIKILEEYSKKGLLEFYSGENIRPAKSFMNLVENAPNSEYYAFSDQDDFWLEDKLSTAINYLKNNNFKIPILYYSSLTLVDENLNKINSKMKRKAFLTFKQSAICSNCAGCTMCFNKELLNALKIYDSKYLLMHDEWIHKVCLAIGGKVFFDNNSYILYRQHGDNVIGGASSLKKIWTGRIKRFFKAPRMRSEEIKDLLNGYKEMMSDDNKKICESISNYNNSFYNRVKLLFNREIKTGDKSVDRMFKIAVLFGRF